MFLHRFVFMHRANAQAGSTIASCIEIIPQVMFELPVCLSVMAVLGRHYIRGNPLS